MNILKVISLASLLALAVSSEASAGPATGLPTISAGTISVNLQPIATGLGAPNYGISEPGDPTRLFVLDQKGLVRVIQNGSMLPTPALDVMSLIGTAINTASANEERGLLGLAFSPGFSDSRSTGFHTLYTYSSQANGTPATFGIATTASQTYKNVINEWKLSSTDPNVIDPSSRREILSLAKNATNHNGGTIAFGPDGYLYLGTGDGGNANDVGPSHVEPGGNAQNLGVALGKMLRIDPLNPSLNPGSPDPVSGNGQYRVPASNPFHDAGQIPEIYAYGLRNPYRYSFDTATGQLICADVGQNTIEEIDRITSGANYGWAVKEGDFLFNRVTSGTNAAGTVGVRSPGSPAGLTDPISGPAGTLEYDHTEGISIIGGFVYHGSAIPELSGKYIFGDLALVGSPVRINGRLFYADLNTGAINQLLLPQFGGDILPNSLTVHGFGQDANGELYVMATNTAANGTGGIVYEITAVPEPSTGALFFCSGAIGLLGYIIYRRASVVLSAGSTPV